METKKIDMGKIDKKSRIIIDTSVIIDIIEGNNNKKSMDVFKKIRENKLNCITTSSSLMRAIYLAKPESQLEKLQSIIDYIMIIPTFANFKNKESVTKEIILLANRFSREKNNEK